MAGKNIEVLKEVYEFESDINESEESDYEESNHGDKIHEKSSFNKDQKRAHHNTLEKQRRSRIKESFMDLKQTINGFHFGKPASSRIQILRKSSDYIRATHQRVTGHQMDIEDLTRQNSMLKQQLKILKREVANLSEAEKKALGLEDFDWSSDSSSDSESSSSSDSEQSP